MTTEDLVAMYISLKKIFYNNPYLKPPKRETKDWDDLNRLRILLEENEISCEDYLMVHVRAYRRRNLFPRPHHLLSIKSLNKYSEHLRKSFVRGIKFRLDKYSALIYATNTYYTIDEFTKPFDKDLKVILVWTLIRENNVEFEKQKSDKIWEVAEYVLAKYEWAKQTPPDSLLKWKEKLDEARKHL